MHKERPWLDKKKWAENKIASDARAGHWILWAFAAVWNLLTLPLFLQIEEILEKVQQEPATLLVFLFPLVGFVLIVLAGSATRRRLLFGQTPLELDPFPGSLGGHVGGRIDTSIPYDQQHYFAVSLSCVHSRVTKSGKNRSRSESLIWHSEGICHSERGLKGTALGFRFDVPADLTPSEPRSRSYHLWRLRVNAELPGADFDRCWELPVYDTGGKFSSIREGTETHPATIDAAMAGVESIADITPVADGIQARFPAFQRTGSGIFTVIFGALFAGIGIFAGFNGGVGYLFAALFVFLGTLVGSAGVFYLGKSLLVVVTPQGVRSRRFLFGYPIKTRELDARDVQEIRIEKSGTFRSGKKTTVIYQLYAHGTDGTRLPLAERLNGRPEAELLRDTYVTYLGKG